MVDYTSRIVTKATSRLRDIIFQLFENDDENDDYSCLEFRPNYRIAKANHFIYIKLLQIKITNCSILILRIVLFFHCFIGLSSSSIFQQHWKRAPRVI